MRIWTLSKEARPETLLWDTKGEDYICLSAAWVGSRLAYWRLNGVSSYTQFEDAIMSPVHPNPYGDAGAFVRSNSQTWLWDPTNGGHEVLLEEESGILVGDREGQFLVVCEGTGTPDPDFSDRGGTTVVEVFSVDERRRIAHNAAAGTGRRIHFPSQFTEQLLLPYLHGHGQDRSFLLVGRLQAPLIPGDEVPVGVPALVSVSLDGTAAFLTNGSTARLGSAPPGLPTAVTLPSGEHAIACVLNRWRTNPYRLVCLGLDGTTMREYRFGPHWGVVQEATGEKTECRPITVTPDGSHLLLQETGKTDDVALGEDRWVWLWDLEHETGTRAARLPNIKACYGWVHDEHLLLQVAEGERGRRRSAVTALWVEWPAGLR